MSRGVDSGDHPKRKVGPEHLPGMSTDEKGVFRPVDIREDPTGRVLSIGDWVNPYYKVGQYPSSTRGTSSIPAHHATYSEHQNDPETIHNRQQFARSMSILTPKPEDLSDVRRHIEAGGGIG